MKYTKINEYLHLQNKKLLDKGIHNGFLLSDSSFYVDPEKLANCDIPEFKDSINIIKDRIKKVLLLLKNSENEQDQEWKAAYNLFAFKEPKFVALGLGIGTIEKILLI